MSPESQQPPLSQPIIFDPLMVEAILQGRKTQSCHLISPQPTLSDNGAPRWGTYNGRKRPNVPKRTAGGTGVSMESLIGEFCPFGEPNDLLWVRETTLNVEEHGYVGPVYLASELGNTIREAGLGPDDDYTEVEPEHIKLRPGIHMPRAYARLTLQIERVRVQHLHDLTEADAQAQGFTLTNSQTSYRAAFEAWWRKRHGNTSWQNNPWVWVLDFRMLPRPEKPSVQNTEGEGSRET